jgi:hypothetical protein
MYEKKITLINTHTHTKNVRVQVFSICGTQSGENLPSSEWAQASTVEALLAVAAV